MRKASKVIAATPYGYESLTNMAFMENPSAANKAKAAPVVVLSFQEFDFSKVILVMSNSGIH